jgi:hypothetical protein
MAVVADDAELLQQIQVAIHRGRRCRGVKGTAPLHELGPADVPIRIRQDRKQKLALRSPARALSAGVPAGLCQVGRLPGGTMTMLR